MLRLRVAALLSVGLLSISVLTPRAHALSGQAGYLQSIYQDEASSGLTGVAVDSAGNVFFSDDGDNEVKECRHSPKRSP
jgi:hypothetical protein